MSSLKVKVDSSSLLAVGVFVSVSEFSVPVAEVELELGFVVLDFCVVEFAAFAEAAVVPPSRFMGFTVKSLSS